jgi:hypothetical protein
MPATQFRIMALEQKSIPAGREERFTVITKSSVVLLQHGLVGNDCWRRAFGEEKPAHLVGTRILALLRLVIDTIAWPSRSMGQQGSTRAPCLHYMSHF